ncbi:MAG: DUF7310 family coiled-coil domain-containing protein [Halodesulfurarchaeum sp.]
MPQRRTIEERLAALERRLDAEAATIGSVSDTRSGKSATNVEQRSDRLLALEETVAELEASVQALRGYVGNVEHVNESVERRANAALAAVERLESAPKTPPPIAAAEPPEPPDPEEEPVSDEEPGTADRVLERLGLG